MGSAAFIVAAGVGLVALSSSAEKEPAAAPTTTAPTMTVEPKAPTKTDTSAVVPKRHKPKSTQAPDDVVPKVYVEVYNNSGISGLAADKAALLLGAGWNVAATDNWYGNIPESTVYFPAMLESDARKLAKVLHVTRLRPAVSPMQFDRLTVILTSA